MSQNPQVWMRKLRFLINKKSVKNIGLWNNEVWAKSDSMHFNLEVKDGLISDIFFQFCPIFRKECQISDSEPFFLSNFGTKLKITSEIKPPFNKVQSVSEIDNVPHSFLLILVTGKIIGMKNWRAWISMFFTSTEWKNHGIRLWFAYNNAKPKHLKLGWIGCAIWLTNHKRIQLFFSRDKINAFTKGQSISECPFRNFKFSKNPPKNLTDFCPRI